MAEVLISIWFYINEEVFFWLYITGSLTIIFLFFALVRPKWLSFIYQPWMILAFAIGWIVSRLLLILIFYIVLTPIGILGRIFGKRWMDKKFDKNLKTYWITKSRDTMNNYEKMY